MKTIKIKLSELENTKAKTLIKYLIDNNIAALPKNDTSTIDNTPLKDMVFKNDARCIDAYTDYVNIIIKVKEM